MSTAIPTTPHAAESMEHARWFDGHSTQPHPVRARWSGQALEIHAADDHASAAPLRRFEGGRFRIGEAWAEAPTPVALPDGSTLWLPAGSAIADALQPPGLATRLSASWRAALCSLAMLLALLVWLDRQGIGLAARALLPLVPTSLDKQIGDQVERQLTGHWILHSRLPASRSAALKGRFQAIADRVFPGLYPRVVFCRIKGGDVFNAFALPNGALFVTDEMAQALSDDQIMAVLAHEAGHVLHRHAMRRLIEGVGLIAVAQVALNDYSGLASTSLATLQSLRYSRDAEREADGDAHRMITRESLPADTLAGVWRTLERRPHASAGTDVPVWLSTHPGPEERIESAMKAAAAASAARAR